MLALLAEQVFELFHEAALQRLSHPHLFSSRQSFGVFEAPENRDQTRNGHFRMRLGSHGGPSASSKRS